MKILSVLFFVLTMLSSVVALAAQPQRTYAESETINLNILLAKDGTGIIKDITCPYCDFNFVKITPKTQVFVNGRKVDISRAAGRFGKAAFIQFSAKTAEVTAIRWSE